MPANRINTTILCCALFRFASGDAAAQSSAPAAFVANNGNLEGAVSSFVFDATGVPQFVNKATIGQRPNTQMPEPGTNAYGITISPNGRFLMTSHATESTTVEQLTLLNVAADATVSIARTFTTPDSPLDVAWVTDNLIAVTRTRLSGVNQVILYEIDVEVGTLTERDRADTSNFTAHLAAHPNGQFLYAGDSNALAIFVFAVDPAGALDPVETEFTPSVYPLGIAITPDGNRLYGCGGISNGGNKFLAYDIAADGSLSAVAGMPFVSPGSSPAYATFSSDSGILFLGHGTDATVRSFLLDAAGVPTSTGNSFDVGLQGSIGDIAVLRDLLLITDDTSATDGITGLYSFDVETDGSFLTNGPAVGTQATAPTEIAVWSPLTNCPGDVDGDSDVDLGDLTAFLANFGLCSGDAGFLAAADFDANGCITLADLTVLLGAFGSACP